MANQQAVNQSSSFFFLLTEVRGQVQRHCEHFMCSWGAISVENSCYLQTVFGKCGPCV